MSIRPLQLAAGALVSFALVLGATPAFAGSPTPAPKAAPNVQAAPQISVPAKHKAGTARINSKANNDLAKILVKVTSSAHTNSKGQIDYRWVKKSFGKHTTYVNAFAAGWWSRRHDWKQFTHISTSDKKKVIAWAKTHGGPNPKKTSNAESVMSSVTRTGKAPQFGARPMAPKPCLGVTKEVPKGADLDYIYLNSCDTRTVIAWNTAAIPTYGAISAVLVYVTAGSWTIPGAVGTIALAGNLAWFVWAKDSSTIEAIWFRISRPLAKNSKGWYYAPYWVGPQ